MRPENEVANKAVLDLCRKLHFVLAGSVAQFSGQRVKIIGKRGVVPLELGADRQMSLPAPPASIAGETAGHDDQPLRVDETNPGGLGKAPVDSDLARRFAQLAERWKRETLVVSSVEVMSTHPAYQQIIGMGPEVLPLLLHELAESPHHWFWALRSITGEDPVQAQHRGRLSEMANDWLTWAKNKGYDYA